MPYKRHTTPSGFEERPVKSSVSETDFNIDWWVICRKEAVVMCCMAQGHLLAESLGLTRVLRGIGVLGCTINWGAGVGSETVSIFLFLLLLLYIVDSVIGSIQSVYSVGENIIRRGTEQAFDQPPHISSLGKWRHWQLIPVAASLSDYLNEQLVLLRLMSYSVG